MKPSIGRIVHLQEDGVTLAAIITHVHEDGTVDLTVFPNNGTTFVRYAVAEGPAGWTWPPRV